MRINTALRIAVRQNVAVVIFVLYALLCAIHGQFGDEDEKIAAGVFAHEGYMPYQHILINHGPLPFLLGCLGYTLGGSAGSLLALRTLPILLASISIVSLRKSSLFLTKSSAVVAQVTWTAILMLLWAQGTLRMGIYHGVGGLIACIVIGECIGPTHLQHIRPEKELAKTLSLCMLMISTSITFLPFALLAILAAITGSRFTELAATRKKSRMRAGSLPQKSARTNSLLNRIAQQGMTAAALSPALSIALLDTKGTISWHSLYLCHIYYNLNILSRLAPAFNFSLAAEGPKSGLPATLLAAAVIILPISVVTYLNRHTSRTYSLERATRHGPVQLGRKGTILGNFSAACTSISVLTLAYRTGFGKLDDFHSLPYILPALFIALAYSLRYLEEKPLDSNQSFSHYRSSARLALAFATTAFPVALIGIHRLEGRSAINIGSEIHPAISTTDRMYPEKKRIERLILAIESKENRRATLLAWPFRPEIYYLLKRASKLPVIWYLWYNELVERDQELSKYHVCSRVLNEMPDLIFYNRWTIKGRDSQKYGACLIDIQDKYYNRLNGFLISKKHGRLLKSLFLDPSLEDIALTPLWSLEEVKKGLVPITLKANQTARLKMEGIFQLEGDKLGLMLGTYSRKNSGTVKVCIVSEYLERSCSQEIDKSTLVDNRVKIFLIPGYSSRHMTRSFVGVDIIDKSPKRSDRRSNEIAVYVLQARTCVSRRCLTHAAAWTAAKLN